MVCDGRQQAQRVCPAADLFELLLRQLLRLPPGSRRALRLPCRLLWSCTPPPIETAAAPICSARAAFVTPFSCEYTWRPMGWFSRKPPPHPHLRELIGLRCCLTAWRRAVIEHWHQDGVASHEELTERLSQLGWYNAGAGGADPFTEHVLQVPVGDLDLSLLLGAHWRTETAAASPGRWASSTRSRRRRNARTPRRWRACFPLRNVIGAGDRAVPSARSRGNRRQAGRVEAAPDRGDRESGDGRAGGRARRVRVLASIRTHARPRLGS